MRVEIPHTLGKDEVRRRLATRTETAQSKASALIGSPLTLTLDWIDQDHLAVNATVMGYTIPTTMEVGETTLVFDVTIPPGLGFARGMIETAIRDRGNTLLLP